jgi:putative phosphonate metabolism protein
MTARYAIYFTLPSEAPLGRFGAQALGYDCADAADVPQLSIDGIAPDTLVSLTAEPRRYGFHATLAAPFRLGNGREAELLAAAAAFAQTQSPVRLGALAVTRIGAFVALCPTHKQPALAELEAACVHGFHPFRAPMTAAERERRLKAALTPHQIALMDRWGYPYVLDQYRFHMTLTGPLPAGQRDEVARAFAQAYAPLADDPVEIDAISVMRQDDASSRFRVVGRFSFTGG